ncbi:hypothetical protein PPSC2_28720 (plasmid) [Paenibacillus polymyxa SC2]|uniref:Uncharacterized protein n=2 Tax=Paenibacillus polymyxa TaxID=1406 RepID=A0A0D5ZCQ5_PAEPS|nr:hypothetical protein PPSC2_28720 [Paenibacillus polymyxa SC2]
MYEYFQHGFWMSDKLCAIEAASSHSNTRLSIIGANFRLYTELKQLERELQRHSIFYEVQLPYRNVVLDCVLCWMWIESKHYKWSEDIQSEITELLFENSLEFFTNSVGFLPTFDYQEIIFLEIAVEFIRIADELTLEYRYNP